MAEEKIDTEKLKDSLDQLIEPLGTQLSQLQMWLQCRNLDVTDQNIEDLRSIDKMVSNLEQTVSDMDAIVTKEEESIIYIERMYDALKLQRKRINYLSKNCESIKLPQLTNAQHLQPSQALKTILMSNSNNNNDCNNDNMNNYFFMDNNGFNNDNMSNENGNGNVNNHNKMKSRSFSHHNSKVTATSDGGQASKKRRLNPSSQSVSSPQSHGSHGSHGSSSIPQIELIGKDEFDHVPKYVKSRLTQERVNNAIDDFNSELKKKYKVLRLNPNKLASHQFEQYDRYMKQETAETKGSYFLGENDLKASQYFTQDQTGRAVLNVLRHVKRVKMLGGKHTKYIVC